MVSIQGEPMKGKIQEWIRITSMVLGWVLLLWFVLQKWSLEHENADLRRERINSDSLHQVAVNQWERKVREVESERDLMVQLKDKNNDLWKELKKRGVTIRQLQELTIALKADSGRGVVYVDSTRSEYRFTLSSDNGIVVVNGVLQTRPPKAFGAFTFAPLPPISVVLYEDELKYIDARVTIDERYLKMVSFNVQKYEPSKGPSWKAFVGAGITRSFDAGVSFGPLVIGGVTWSNWGVGGMIGANSYGMAFIRSF